MQLQAKPGVTHQNSLPASVTATSLPDPPGNVKRPPSNGGGSQFQMSKLRSPIVGLLVVHQRAFPAGNFQPTIGFPCC